MWVAVQTDVTERRRAEQELRHAEERFRKVFEEGPVGIVMFSDDLTISDGNDAFCRITGYTRDELIGRSIADVTHPADAVLDVDRAYRVFEGGLPSYRVEKRCLTREGGTVWVSFTATMVRDDSGKPLYGLGIVEDISERKRIEALMTRQNERLSTDLESSLAELQLSRARILASADLERRRIERDLHDGAQQRLVALRVRLGLAQDLLREDPLRGSAMLSDLGNDVDAALDEVRMLARGVYPSVLGDRGLVEALRTAARNSPLAVSIRASAVGRLPEEIETAVYFACVEALQNAAKHAQRETSVLISLRQGKRSAVRGSRRGSGIYGEWDARGRRPLQHARPHRSGRRPAGDRVRVRRGHVRQRECSAALTHAHPRVLVTCQALTEGHPPRLRRRR